MPIFPRWFGWFNIWIVIIYLPGSFIALFKRGPFAWNGLLAWWIPLTLFVIWMVATTYLLLKAIERQEREASSATPLPERMAEPIAAEWSGSSV
ncbi:MAG: hypothetical protein ABW034_00230 [Steroidobacteraceae bacterium]